VNLYLLCTCTDGSNTALSKYNFSRLQKGRRAARPGAFRATPQLACQMVQLAKILVLRLIAAEWRLDREWAGWSTTLLS
jgi:hypothetical protein